MRRDGQLLRSSDDTRLGGIADELYDRIKISIASGNGLELTR